jgi:hypothetical protein
VSARWPGTAAFLAAAGLAIAAGLVLRVAGAQGDLWLDEIRSLNLVAARAPAPLDVFWSVQHAASHPLYALYLWFVGHAPAPLVARLPAVMLGAASVIVAGMIGARHGRAEALFAMALVALSYPLVHYGSEAHGTGPMLFCALLAFQQVDADLAAGTARRRLVVAGALVAGVLFHVAAALVAAALWLWVVLRGLARRRSLAEALGRAGQLFAPTMIGFIAVLVLAAAAMLANGYTAEGGAPADGAGPLAALGALAGLLFGLPAEVPAALALALFVAAALGVILWLRARGDERWPFYALMVFGVPASLLAGVPSGGGRAPVLLLGLVFALPLAAQALARAWRRGILARLIAVAALAAFVVGSARLEVLFLKHGRGQYRAAINLMTDSVHGSTFSVGSDDDVRQRTVLAYHMPHAARGETLDYVPWDQLESHPPDWFIVHRRPALAAEPPAPERMTFTLKGSTWVLAARYRAWGLSGFDWLLYRRVPPA